MEDKFFQINMRYKVLNIFPLLIEECFAAVFACDYLNSEGL